MNRVALFLMAILFAGASFATTYHVASDGDDGNDGVTLPVKTVSVAVAKCTQDGDEVVIAASATPYPVTAAMTLSLGVTVRGATGKPEDVILRSDRTKHRVFFLNNAAALVTGLVVENADNMQYGDIGGAIGINSAGGTVSNCVVRGCSMGDWGKGGAGIGIYSGAANALVTHCVISNCWSYCRVSGSNFPGGGGALAMYAGNIRNCLVLKNSYEPIYDTTYGTVRVNGGTLENCTIVDNFAGTKCSGVWAVGGKVRNCLIAGNRTSSATATDAVWAGTSSCFTNCVSDVSAINLTCKYSETPYAGFSSGNYRPAPGSVSVEGGAYQPWMEGATDFEGNDRIRGDYPDIGCYEIDPYAFSATFAFAEGTYGFANERVHVTVSPAFVGALGTMCEWDWNGDGTYDETTYGTSTSHVYTTYGTFNVTVRVTDVSSGKSCVAPANAFTIHPRQVYVAKAGSATPPYGDKTTAANDLATAYASAVDGAEIVFVPDTYTMTAQLDVSKAVTIRSETGRAEDVVLKSDGKDHRIFSFDNAAARLVGVTVTGARNKDYGSLGGCPELRFARRHRLELHV